MSRLPSSSRAASSRTPRFLFVPYGSIDQAIERGTAEIGLSGMEDTPARRAAMATTIPYYAFREVLAVRDADAGTLRGSRRSQRPARRRRSAARSPTKSCSRRERQYGLQAVSYDDDVHPYSDLLLGRVDAVLLDNVLAERRRKSMAGITVQPEAVAMSHYVGVLASQKRPAARRGRTRSCAARCATARSKRIFRKWNVWNDDQPALYASLIAREAGAGRRSRDRTGPIGVADDEPMARPTLRYVPSLVQGGGRHADPVVPVDGDRRHPRRADRERTRVRTTARATRADRIRRADARHADAAPAVRDLLRPGGGRSSCRRSWRRSSGLALNYAAYESEIYRGALEAVPAGQLEAARTLGFTERQVLRLVRGPQAFRLALAPMTNDFVALLKDSSLVSVLTVVELTKQTQIFATNLGSWVIPGTLCAAIYLADVAAARRRWRAGSSERWKAPTA